MFDNFDDRTRLWIFPLNRTLSETEVPIVQASLNDNLANWLSHKVAVASEVQIVDGRFILVVGDVEGSGPSGCSIDSLFREVSTVVRRLNLELLDNSYAYFQGENGVEALERAEFGDRASSFPAREDTLVYDNSIQTVGELRTGKWRKRLAESWHKALISGIAASR